MHSDYTEVRSYLAGERTVATLLAARCSHLPPFLDFLGFFLNFGKEIRNLTHNSSAYSRAAQDKTDRTPVMFLEEMNLNSVAKWDTHFFSVTCSCGQTLY